MPTEGRGRPLCLSDFSPRELNVLSEQCYALSSVCSGTSSLVGLLIQSGSGQASDGDRHQGAKALIQTGAHTHTNVHTQKHTHTHIPSHENIAYTCSCVHTCTHTLTCIHICAYTSEYNLHMFSNAHLGTYMRTNTGIHVYIHTHQHHMCMLTHAHRYSHMYTYTLTNTTCACSHMSTDTLTCIHIPPHANTHIDGLKEAERGSRASGFRTFLTGLF